MADTRDTLFRQWTMLQKLPRHPQNMATQAMVAYLRDEGFTVTSRTVERDLAKLSTIFGYTSEEDGRSQLWFWPHKFKTIDIPGLDPSTALAFSLAEKHLSQLLPPATLELLGPYFQRAAEVLDTSHATPLGPWRDKVRVIGVGPKLQPAKIDESIQTTLYQALLNSTRVELVYEARAQEAPRTYEFSPLALVSRQGVLYLVGPFWDYGNVVQIALHRVHSVQPTSKSVHIPGGFNIDTYIEKQAGFSYPTGSGHIGLVLIFSGGAGTHLEERPLSEDQITVHLEDDRLQIQATVLDTDDLAWWILGFGPNVEVLKPAVLRKKVAEITSDTAAIYSRHQDI